MTFQRLPQVPPMELPENLKEMFAQMEAHGLHPEFCDTPVPYFDAGIRESALITGLRAAT